MLAWLLAGHLIGDFLLQNRWMSENKEKKALPLLLHSAVYSAAVFALSLAAGGLSIAGVLLIFITHVILDRRRFVRWWCKNITKSYPQTTLLVMTDQAWHVAALVLACILDVYLKGVL